MKNLILILSVFVMAGCSAIRPTPKTALVDGIYTQKKDNQKRKVYVDVEYNALRIYGTQSTGNQLMIDSVSTSDFYTEQIKEEIKEKILLSKQSFDIDLLTIPLKYRVANMGVPPQLNTNINGAVFLGYRIDKYVVSYQPDFLQRSLRNITHYGFSFGVFNGLGNTDLTPTNTFNNISQEYDGMVWNKGLAGILAVNNFTIGISLGVDNLLDKNKKVWIYESKPWVGIAFGLNLN